MLSSTGQLVLDLGSEHCGEGRMWHDEVKSELKSEWLYTEMSGRIHGHIVNVCGGILFVCLFVFWCVILSTMWFLSHI